MRAFLCVSQVCSLHMICDMVNYVDDRDHFIMLLCIFTANSECLFVRLCVCECAVCSVFALTIFKAFTPKIALPFQFSARTCSIECGNLFSANMHCCVLLNYKSIANDLVSDTFIFGINSWTTTHQNHSVLIVQLVHFGRKNKNIVFLKWHSK